MDTKLRILKESGRLFSKYGIKSVTMDMIATHLGVSKRTLYEVFGDKDELVRQTIEEGILFHKRLCQQIIKDSDNFITAIFRIFDLNTKTFGKINSLFFEDLKKYHFQALKEIQQKSSTKDYNLTEELLNKGVEQAIFDKSLNYELIKEFIHKIIDITHDEEFGHYEKNDVFRSIFIPYIYGISTDAGRQLINKYLEKI